MLEVFATGKTVDEATENGIKEIGLSRDEVSVEIVDMPVNKLFKKIPAKVKITANIKEEKEVKPVKEEVVKKAEIKKEIANDKKAEKIVNEEEIEIDINSNKQLKIAVEYLKDIFEKIHVENIEINAYSQGDATLLRINGNNIQDLIETKGEVVQALSYLTDRSVNKGIDKKSDEYLRIRLDIAGYRNRREAELIELADKIGKEVLRTKRSKTLAPMNPYERLIVHTAISKMDGLKSESKGEDTLRRVVIRSTAPDAIEGDDWRPERKEYNNNRSGKKNNYPNKNKNYSKSYKKNDNYRSNNYNGKKSTPNREFVNKPKNTNAKPVVPERREAIKDGENIPLYGKIEL